MAEFGLMRGELGSEAVHDGQTEYNANLMSKLKWNWRILIFRLKLKGSFKRLLVKKQL
jgi:hypothetical protein